MSKSSATSSQRRRERERQDHRALIFAAALELFSEKGYYDVSMNEIADRAGFATGTLYNFFKSKDEIYRSIVLETQAELVEKLMALLESRSGVAELLREYVISVARFANESLPVVKLAIAEYVTVTGPAAHIRDRMKERDAQLEKRLAAVMKRGMRSGIIRKGDPLFLAVSLNELLRACLIREVQEKRKSVDPRYMESLYELFMKGASASRA